MLKRRTNGGSRRVNLLTFNTTSFKPDLNDRYKKVDLNHSNTY